VRAEVKALACELPATTGVPLSRWSCAELALDLVVRAVAQAISAATVWRILDLGRRTSEPCAGAPRHLDGRRDANVRERSLGRRAFEPLPSPARA
jgi:hypothetical protein